MAISSASTKVFKAEDPVMETDLQLLAKVNEYQQDKFDAGEKNLQDEINNWSMLANVAKPQDRDYINTKLNNLVSGIKNLGGVDLSDPNNVNSLKSLGYNMYGDQNVMNPVMTTRKMQALQQDIYNKTNGKNASQYDSVYGEYLTNKYSDWLNDGQQGTSFDGPTSLPQGSFEEYNKKIVTTLKGLTPDLNEAPQNAADALNYYQVGDKFIRKDRYYAAIDAATSAQDRDILSAHAWKSMQGINDTSLVGMQAKSYDSKVSDLQNTWNTLAHDKALAKGDWEQTQLFTNQMNQVSNAIKDINAQKRGLPALQEGQNLDEETRQNLRDNLFTEAFKEQYGNAFAFDQKKTELKMNQGRAVQLRMDQTAWMFGKNYDLRVAEFNDKKQEEQMKHQENMLRYYGMFAGNSTQLGLMGINGPAQTAPLSVIQDKGKDDAIKLSDNITTQADANYIAKANNFYSQGYNYLVGKDANTYSKYVVKDGDGNWVPKDDESKKILDAGIDNALDKYSGIANMSIKERNGLNLSDDEVNFIQSSSDLQNAKLYKQQMDGLRDDVFRNAGQVPPSKKDVTIQFKPGSKFGPSVTISYDKLKEMQDRNDPKLKDWKDDAKPATYEPGFLDQLFGVGEGPKWLQQFKVAPPTSADFALKAMNSYYDNSDVKKQWEKASQNFNTYGANISLPKGKAGKVNQGFEPLQDYFADQIRQQHPEVSGSVQKENIDLVQVYPVVDAENADKTGNYVRYMAKVMYQKGSGQDNGKKLRGDKIATIDVTNEVLREHGAGGGWLAGQYADDDTQVVYGMLLSGQGKTPMNRDDNYASALQTTSNPLLAHKYQIVAMKNNTNGIDGYRVNVLIPKGKDQNGVPQYETFPVKNLDANTSASKVSTGMFPPNFKYVQMYMNDYFSTSEKAKDFYAAHGIPYLPDQSTNQ